MRPPTEAELDTAATYLAKLLDGIGQQEETRIRRERNPAAAELRAGGLQRCRRCSIFRAPTRRHECIAA